MNAQAILHNLIKRYSTCQTYSDVGFSETKGQPKPRLDFRTYFCRPDKFRFEWTDYHPYFGKSTGPQHYALWSDGKKVYTCYHFNDYQVRETGSLLLAVAGATGISSGAAYFIHSLLLSPGRFPPRLFRFKSCRKLEDDQIDGESCYVINGARKYGHNTTMWVRTSDYVVKRRRDIMSMESTWMLKAVTKIGEMMFGSREKSGFVDEYGRNLQLVHVADYSEVRFDDPLDDQIFHGPKLPLAKLR
jgi:hypothetical protein